MREKWNGLRGVRKELLPEGAVLRAISPFGWEPVQRAVSPISAWFLGLFSLKSLNCEKQNIRRPDGTSMKVCVYRSNVTTGKRVGILWLHGGGYVLGAPEMVGISFPHHLLKTQNCVIVAPEYTLSAKAPYPAALNDAYTALQWMEENRATLGIEAEKFVVGGESAGGGLTCALTQYVRDKGETPFVFSMPLYPMADDRPTNTNQNNYAPVWDSASNDAAWRIYLGNLYGTDNVPPNAAPARQTNYEGLPPAISIVGDIEPFYAETLHYFVELQGAGVPTSLKVYHGCYHAFDMMAPYSKVSKEATAFLLSAYGEFAEKFS